MITRPHSALQAHKRSEPPSQFYRRFFTREECAALDATPVDDLSSEINVLRLLIARVLAACKRARQISLELHAAVLSAFSAAGIVISRLVSLQLKLRQPADEIRAEIERGEEIGRRRLGVYGYFAPPAPLPAS